MDDIDRRASNQLADPYACNSSRRMRRDTAKTLNHDRNRIRIKRINTTSTLTVISLSLPLCHADSNNDDHISQFFDFFVQFLFGYFDASIGDTLQGLHRAFQRFETRAHFFLHFFHISHRLLIAFVEPLRNCLLDRLESDGLFVREGHRCHSVLLTSFFRARSVIARRY